MMLASALVFAAALLIMGAVQVSNTTWFAPVEEWLPWMPALTELCRALFADAGR